MKNYFRKNLQEQVYQNQRWNLELTYIWNKKKLVCNIFTEIFIQMEIIIFSYVSNDGWQWHGFIESCRKDLARKNRKRASCNVPRIYIIAYYHVFNPIRTQGLFCARVKHGYRLSG